MLASDFDQVAVNHVYGQRRSARLPVAGGARVALPSHSRAFRAGHQLARLLAPAARLRAARRLTVGRQGPSNSFLYPAMYERHAGMIEHQDITFAVRGSQAAANHLP